LLALTGGALATWVFQGNPTRFDVDDYVARYPELIYWRTPRHAKEIVPGDRVFIWRAGPSSGAIAVGVVVEAPTPGSKVKHPEALGSDLWRAEEPDLDEPRTGIHLQEVRLTDEEAYLHRSIARVDPELGKATIITMPNGTVFPLTSAQALAMERLWGSSGRGATPDPSVAVSEGELRLSAHRRRERSTVLRDRKLAEVRATFGRCACALCGLTEDSTYPPVFAARIFEVHHLSPLSKAATPVRTTLADLAVLCANCHRAVHATPAVEENYAVLAAHLRCEG
jgi:hypothetical protein